LGAAVVTRIDDALAGVARLGLDTAPFIYFVERNPRYVDRVRQIVRRIATGSIAGYTSVITLTEVLAQPLRLGNTTLAQRYRRFLTRSQHLSLVSIDLATATRAAELRARYGLRTPDALQVAAALGTGCAALLTNDAGLQRVTELRVLTLDELEL
jgi:predicted nucleic acid-binding protein